MSEPVFTILDNSNIVESYPGITLPLTYSFIKIAYTGVFKGAIGANLKNDEIMAKYKNVFDNMIKHYKGRVYYCINNWYSLIDFIPFSKKIIPVWQDMMGVEESEVYMGKYHKFTFWQKARLTFNMIKSAFSVPRDMKRLEGYFEEVQKYFDETYNEGLVIPELIELFHEIERRVLDKWYITIFNDLYAFIWTGLLKRKLAKKGVDVTEYISGITGLESLKPVKALLNLAKKYGDEPNILDFPEVQQYIKIYGDRCSQELKLECMTYREFPELLVEQIRIYAQDRIKLDEMILRLETHKDAKADFTTKRAKLGIMNREISRLNRSRIYGMVRRIFIDIGKKAFEDNWFDIFYMTTDEVFAWRFDEELIAQRKAEFAKYEEDEEHAESTERTEHAESTERTEYAEYVEHAESTERTEYAEHVEYAESTERAEHAEHVEHAEHAEQLESSERAEHIERIDRAKHTEYTKYMEYTKHTEYADYTDYTKYTDYADYSKHKNTPPSTRIVFRGDIIIDESVAKKWTGSFVGTGTSQGVFEGEAIVLSEPDANIDVNNKIIVTKTTDPGWVFLLCQASGLVAEKGSLLSHTAIVSRELKIPAVVGVDSATSVIKTGDIIRINGEDGRVEIVKAC
ncbi:MAG: PEP-utilizing enzyme [Synergistaceae bacterium]|nr:PEP-utilizing enzyme [Synergistaceae bacterium]